MLLSSHSQVLAPAVPMGYIVLQLPQEGNLGVCDPKARKEPNSGSRSQHLDTSSFPGKMEGRKPVSDDIFLVFSGASLCCC